MFKTARSCLAAALLWPLPILAQTPPATQTPAPAAPAAPAPAPSQPAKPAWYNAVTFSGLVDAYYQLRFDAAQDALINQRAFDGDPVGGAGFNLGYVKLSAAMAPSPVGFRLDLGFGPTADAIDRAAFFATAGNPRAAYQPTAAHYVQQAYAALKLGPVELNVGRFVTAAGAEVIEAKDNWLYSRSLLFNLVPITHTGVRAVVPITDTLSLTVGANNGWDAVKLNYPGKTAQASLAWTGPRSTTLAANLYIGNNPTTWAGLPNTNGNLRTLIDVVAGTTAGPLSFSANFDWATEAADPWFGFSGMVRYSLPGDFLRVTGRGEFVKDYNGVRFATGIDTEVFELTGGLALPVGSNAELRLEGRYDHADNDLAFTKGTPSNHQATGTLAALAWF